MYSCIIPYIYNKIRDKRFAFVSSDSIILPLFFKFCMIDSLQGGKIYYPQYAIRGGYNTYFNDMNMFLHNKKSMGCFLRSIKKTRLRKNALLVCDSKYQKAELFVFQNYGG